jgi:hypothetical protein
MELLVPEIGMVREPVKEEVSLALVMNTVGMPVDYIAEACHNPLELCPALADFPGLGENRFPAVYLAGLEYTHLEGVVHLPLGIAASLLPAQTACRKSHRMRHYQDYVIHIVDNT